MHRRRTLGTVLLLLGGWLGVRAGVAQELLSPPASAEQSTTPAGAALRSRPVQVFPQVLSSLEVGTKPLLKLSLFSDVAFDATIESPGLLAPQTRAWYGRLAGVTGGRVTIVVDKGTLAASIHALDRGTFEIRPTGPGTYAVRELSDDRLSCGGVLNAAASDQMAANPSAKSLAIGTAFVPPTPTCDDGQVIDLLVVYTPAAAAAAGGVAAIQALINLAVADTNDAFGRSLITTSISLVHTQQVSYTESGIGATDATRLSAVGDGYLDDVLPLRDQYGADCVSLWVSTLDSGGIGYFPHGSLTGVGSSGISVMRQDNAAGLTLAHELGHNLWCAHDRANASGPPYAEYSYGYREPGGQWHDIMAYPPGFMIPYFANPDVNYPGPVNPGPTGVPVGQPQPCDIALTLNQTRIIVANFRATAVPGLPPVLYVRASAPPGGNGLSWAGAFNDLRKAICRAGGSNGAVQEIWVAAGTYKPDGGSGDRGSTFALVDGVALYGGFAGTEALRTQRDPGVNPTILSGDIGAINVAPDNCYHVVTGSNTDGTAVLDGFTVTAGQADGEWPDSIGGGLYVESGSPTIANCTFLANYGEGGGGGIGAYQAGPTVASCAFQNNDGGAWGGGAILNYVSSDSTITGCTFEGNTAVFGGAVLAAYSSSPSITGCTFTQNTVAPGNNSGAGVYCLSDSHPAIQDCTFTGNTAQYGGAIALNDNCSPSIDSCTFTNNSASSSGGAGGACSLYLNCSPTITNCTFTGNSGNYSGAVEGYDHCDPQFAGCTFRGNTVTGGGGVMSFFAGSNPTFDRCVFGKNTANWGGVMVADDSAPTLVSCLLAGNSASTGGAGACYNGSTPAMINCTIAGNSADFAGGFYAYQAFPAFSNSILWANSNNQGTSQDAQVFYDTSTPSLTSCTVQGWTGSLGGTANNGSNPLFVDADGGDNLYGTADDNPRLQSGSPSINTGSNALLPIEAVSDLDGGPRIISTTVDRGAYEFVLPLAGDFDGDGDIDAADLALFANCDTGPGLGPPAPACATADVDLDNDVDVADFAHFQRCFSGENRAPGPGCGG